MASTSQIGEPDISFRDVHIRILTFYKYTLKYPQRKVSASKDPLCMCGGCRGDVGMQVKRKQSWL